jgi:hypothetical protein
VYVTTGLPGAGASSIKEKRMVGWTILFALMTVAGATAAPVRTTSLLFGLLFLLSVFTRAVRDRAR